MSSLMLNHEVQTFAYKLTGSFVLDLGHGDNSPNAVALRVATLAELMNLGFMLDDLTVFQTLSAEQVTAFNHIAIDVIKSSIGAHVRHRPLFPDFPFLDELQITTFDQQMVSFLNYLTSGFFPEILKDRIPLNKRDKIKKIGVITPAQVFALFKNTLSVNESLTETQTAFVTYCIRNLDVSLFMPAQIPFKETLCLVAAEMLKQGRNLDNTVSTVTDIMRVAAHLSEGDISLADNTKFISFPRKVRKTLTLQLERLINQNPQAALEQFVLRRGEWVRLCHSLHVGDYSKLVYDTMKSVRSNEKIVTYNSKLEAAIAARDVVAITNLLAQRPGMFGRKLCHTISLCQSLKSVRGVMSKFTQIADQIPTRILIQLFDTLTQRLDPLDKIFVIAKSRHARIKEVEINRPGLNKRYVDEAQKAILNVLGTRLVDNDITHNRVFIDPNLKYIPIPTGMRSMSDTAGALPRGSRLPLDFNTNILRLFCYWVGEDIDLSGAFYTEDGKRIGQISFYDLNNAFGSHSGDVRSAPQGGSEFIDVDIDACMLRGARYVAVDVRIYYGPDTFKEHKTCFVGWMERDDRKSGNIYEPTTVNTKYDLTTTTSTCTPVLFDLVERQAIIVDIVPNESGHFSTVKDGSTSVKACIDMFSNTSKFTLNHLFTLYADVNNLEIVDKRELADFSFGVHDGDVSLRDIGSLMERYLK